MVGETICHYRVSEKIGAGGMGVIYRAEDMRLGRQVALKFLPAELAQDSVSLERFLREARAASALNHPGVCTVYAIEQQQSLHFIVMELLEGETLADKIEAGPLPAETLLDVAVQIAAALEAAHAKGIVHRDLKPANVVVNDNGQVKILDFGLAKSTVAPSSATTAVRLTNAGVTVGTLAYMSPEQARGEPLDGRTDLFSLGVVLYEMATSSLPFEGVTAAMTFDAILHSQPPPLQQHDPRLPAELNRIVRKLLEKERGFRYQTATDVMTDLLRLKRDLAAGRAAATPAEKTIAVLYLENLSRAKEDEYLRDGVTEDIVTELSKINGMRIFSRASVLPYRDAPVTPAQIGRELGAAYVLTGSLRRSESRLRINAQLVDTHSGFPLWSERYDRQMEDVFELQDEIAHRIADALRITLTPQEQEALAAKPTENLQAYDLFLRGKSYLRRMTRQDLEIALQLLETAVLLDPNFALAHAATANLCALYHYHYVREQRWLDRAVASYQRARTANADAPEAWTAAAWIHYSEANYAEAARCAREAIARNSDTEGAYYILLRSLFAGGEYQKIVALAETAVAAAGEDTNIYIPIAGAFGALGDADAERGVARQAVEALDRSLKKVPEDVRARIHLAGNYALLGRVEDALREANLAVALRPNESTVLYNLACVFALVGRKSEAMDALRKASEIGYHDRNWARRDPDLAVLRDDPEFDRLYPAQ